MCSPHITPIETLIDSKHTIIHDTVIMVKPIITCDLMSPTPIESLGDSKQTIVHDTVIMVKPIITCDLMFVSVKDSHTSSLGQVMGVYCKHFDCKHVTSFIQYIAQNWSWYSLRGLHFLHARPWIPGDEKSIFTVVIH